MVRTYTLILTAVVRAHTRLVRQRRRASDVTGARGRRGSIAIKAGRLGAGKQLTEADQGQSIPALNKTNMVKITFQPVSAQKPEKDVDGDKIVIPQANVSLPSLLLLYIRLLGLYGVVCNLDCIVLMCDHVMYWDFIASASQSGDPLSICLKICTCAIRQWVFCIFVAMYLAQRQLE